MDDMILEIRHLSKSFVTAVGDGEALITAI